MLAYTRLGVGGRAGRGRAGGQQPRLLPKLHAPRCAARAPGGRHAACRPLQPPPSSSLLRLLLLVLVQALPVSLLQFLRVGLLLGQHAREEVGDEAHCGLCVHTPGGRSASVRTRAVRSACPLAPVQRSGGQVLLLLQTLLCSRAGRQAASRGADRAAGAHPGRQASNPHTHARITPTFTPDPPLGRLPRSRPIDNRLGLEFEKRTPAGTAASAQAELAIRWARSGPAASGCQRRGAPGGRPAPRRACRSMPLPARPPCPRRRPHPQPPAHTVRGRAPKQLAAAAAGRHSARGAAAAALHARHGRGQHHQRERGQQPRSLQRPHHPGREALLRTAAGGGVQGDRLLSPRRGPRAQPLVAALVRGSAAAPPASRRQRAYAPRAHPPTLPSCRSHMTA